MPFRPGGMGSGTGPGGTPSWLVGEWGGGVGGSLEAECLFCNICIYFCKDR